MAFRAIVKPLIVVDGGIVGKDDEEYEMRNDGDWIDDDLKDLSLLDLEVSL